MVDTVRPARLSPVRVGAGALTAAVTLAAAVMFALGAWNPWRLVVLLEYFANPMAGAAAVGAFSYLTLWLWLPIRNEARQRVRIGARVGVVIVTVAGLLGWGLFAPWYTYDATEIARSADGPRAVAHVTAGGLQERDLRIWEGTGLATREVGSLGRPCGGVRAEFAGRDVVMINQGFGDWEFLLDAETGEPRHVFGPRCSDGPRPATIGP
jgi:hypothetical protein